MFRCAVSSIVLFASLSASASAQVVSYKPEDAYDQMADQIRNLIEPTPVAGNWFSVTAIGAVAEKDDPSAINELANFCPDPSKEIVRFGGIRPIDLIYEKAIDQMVAPVHNETAATTAARALLKGANGSSPEYDVYQKYLKESVGIWKNMSLETDPNKIRSLQIDYRNLEDEWKVKGYKNEIEGALFQIDASDGLFGRTRNSHRKAVLRTFRDNGVTAGWQTGSFLSPASEVSPPVGEWENETGWFGVSFDSSTYNKKSTSTSRSSSRGGFLHIGGLVGGASKGDASDNASSISDVKNYGYSFELKRIRIIRKWLDPRVFSTVGGWAWTKRSDNNDYPLISGGFEADNTPIVPKFIVYDNLPVDCPMIPSEMLIARKRTVTLTTSRDNYQKVTTSGSSSGGGMFGGIIGGRKSRSWTTTEISSDGDSVTFKVEAPGTAVIGLMSQLVGRLPAPNPNSNWPQEAWIEGAQ